MKKKPAESNVSDLDKLSVPLVSLRTELAVLNKEGYTRLPLGQLLLLIKKLIDDEKEGS